MIILGEIPQELYDKYIKNNISTEVIDDIELPDISDRDRIIKSLDTNDVIVEN